jgi:DNA-binding GntR family transcriptional regulator
VGETVDSIPGKETRIVVQGDFVHSLWYPPSQRPAPSPGTPVEFLALRRLASRLRAQVKQTSRLNNQLHETLSATCGSDRLMFMWNVIVTEHDLELMDSWNDFFHG